MNRVEQGCFLGSHGHGHVIKPFDYEHTVIFGKSWIALASEQFQDDHVRERPVRLHQIGGQAERIVLVVMVDTKMRMQAGCADMT